MWVQHSSKTRFSLLILQYVGIATFLVPAGWGRAERATFSQSTKPFMGDCGYNEGEGWSA